MNISNKLIMLPTIFIVMVFIFIIFAILNDNDEVEIYSTFSDNQTLNSSLEQINYAVKENGQIVSKDIALKYNKGGFLGTYTQEEFTQEFQNSVTYLLDFSINGNISDRIYVDFLIPSIPNTTINSDISMGFLLNKQDSSLIIDTLGNEEIEGQSKFFLSMFRHWRNDPYTVFRPSLIPLSSDYGFESWNLFFEKEKDTKTIEKELKLTDLTNFMEKNNTNADIQYPFNVNRILNISDKSGDAITYYNRVYPEFIQNKDELVVMETKQYSSLVEFFDRNNPLDLYQFSYVNVSIKEINGLILGDSYTTTVWSILENENSKTHWEEALFYINKMYTEEESLPNIEYFVFELNYNEYIVDNAYNEDWKSDSIDGSELITSKNYYVVCRIDDQNQQLYFIPKNEKMHANVDAIIVLDKNKRKVITEDRPENKNYLELWDLLRNIPPYVHSDVAFYYYNDDFDYIDEDLMSQSNSLSDKSFSFSGTDSVPVEEQLLKFDVVGTKYITKDQNQEGYDIFTRSESEKKFEDLNKKIKVIDKLIENINKAEDINTYNAVYKQLYIEVEDLSTHSKKTYVYEVKANLLER